MSSEKRSAHPDARSGFGPIENEPPQRLFHRMGLAPAGGLGTGRRALLFAAVTWLPIMAWATLTSHLVDTPAGEPLVEHFGVHVRCLIAIPLFILAEAGLNGSVKRIAAQFRSSGAVQPAQEPAFEQSLLRVRSLRDSSLPWVFVLGLTLTWLFVSHPDAHQDAYSWAVSGGGTLGFGGWWFAYVVRPIFLALLLGWIWRIFLLTSWLWRVGRLELSLVASHADRSAGLGFVEKLPIAIAPVTFGLSSVIAGHWAHELAYHDAVLKK
ncbi:MAG TPA: hypothetical protein VEG84_00665, partial [Thermoanaerobaculia bacterium]|nr:hypothetical protein [Thermoanaerobaculia bacterium]